MLAADALHVAFSRRLISIVSANDQELRIVNDVAG